MLPFSYKSPREILLLHPLGLPSDVRRPRTFRQGARSGDDYRGPISSFSPRDRQIRLISLEWCGKGEPRNGLTCLPYIRDEWESETHSPHAYRYRLRPPSTSTPFLFLVTLYTFVLRDDDTPLRVSCLHYHPSLSWRSVGSAPRMDGEEHDLLLPDLQYADHLGERSPSRRGLQYPSALSSRPESGRTSASGADRKVQSWIIPVRAIHPHRPLGRSGWTWNGDVEEYGFSQYWSGTAGHGERRLDG